MNTATATRPALAEGQRVVKDIVFLCSIHPYRIYIPLSFGGRGIDACPPGELFKVTPVFPGINRFDYGDKNTHTVTVDPEQIAKAICTKSVRDLGIGIIDGPEPTEEELAEIKRVHLEFCERMVRQADVDWSRHKGKHEHISDASRRAAKTLGITRDWLTVIVATEECIGCGNNVNSKAAFCAICGTVVNEDAYAELLRREARAKDRAEELGLPEPESRAARATGGNRHAVKGKAGKFVKTSREAPPVGDF